jgi:hypothetical protein
MRDILALVGFGLATSVMVMFLANTIVSLRSDDSSGAWITSIGFGVVAVLYLMLLKIVWGVL